MYQHPSLQVHDCARQAVCAHLREGAHSNALEDPANHNHGNGLRSSKDDGCYHEQDAAVPAPATIQARSARPPATKYISTLRVCNA